MRSSVLVLCVALFMGTVAGETRLAQGQITLSSPQKQVGKYEKLELAIEIGGSTAILSIPVRSS